MRNYRDQSLLYFNCCYESPLGQTLYPFEFLKPYLYRLYVLFFISKQAYPHNEIVNDYKYVCSARTKVYSDKFSSAI